MIELKKGPEKVGYLKSITSEVKLYPSGQLVLNTYSECKAPTTGLRGRVFLVGSDASGRAVWVTKPYKCTTCGGLLDLTAASEFRDNWIEKIEEEIAKVTTSIDIFHSDDRGSGSIAKIFATF